MFNTQKNSRASMVTIGVVVIVILGFLFWAFNRNETRIRENVGEAMEKIDMSDIQREFGEKLRLLDADIQALEARIRTSEIVLSPEAEAARERLREAATRFRNALLSLWDIQKPDWSVIRASVQREWVRLQTAFEEARKVVEEELDVQKPTFGFDPLRAAKQDALRASTLLEVPFTSQAPDWNWDPPYDEACEEASLLMVDHFYKKTPISSRSQADGEILALVKWEGDNGYAIDINAREVVGVSEKYFQRKAKVYDGGDITVENIKRLLSEGYPVVIPVQGQLLGNPNFTGEGPPYHMLVIIGYDSRNFITNDPGTRRGAGYKYTYATIMNAMHDWTGKKETMLEGAKKMIVLSSSQDA